MMSGGGGLGGNRIYSVNSNDYKLLEEVGYGASAVVYRAIYLPLNQLIAVKSLDLDRCNSDLDDIRREAQMMTLMDHSNVIKAFCSFVVGHNLWVVMPFMAEGSSLHLMKIAYPDGLEESVIASILKETLKALEYLHRHGHIHRDVKAGNILLDSNGEIKLADFGVSACMFDTGDRQWSRNTFVGTPCWMAPEVLQPGTGYDFKADIWSLGITALELAHGHAPFSKYPPMKVLLMTIQNAPPGLDYDRDKKFSKSFKEMVAMCLVKDQTKRPTAERLLKHSFFKHAKPPGLSVKKLFADLPPLWKRVKSLQLREDAQLALKKTPHSEQEAISQSEYQRGVSAWNFDLEDLKFQASLVEDEDEFLEFKEDDETMKSHINSKGGSNNLQLRQTVVSSSGGLSSEVGSGYHTPETEMKIAKPIESDLLQCDDIGKLGLEKNRSKAEVLPSNLDRESKRSKSQSLTVMSRQTQSGPLMPGAVLSIPASERARNTERIDPESQVLPEKFHQVRRAPSFSGPLRLPNRASANSLSAPIKSSGGLDDESKTNLVQIKGRFSVTSENVDLAKGTSLRKSASVGDWMYDSKMTSTSQSTREIGDTIIPASILMPQLQSLFQQTAIQQDLLINLLSSMQLAEVTDASQNGKLPPLLRSSEINGNVDSSASERERLFLIRISDLHTRMINLADELNAEKLKYMHLQQRLNGDSREADS